MMLRADAIAGSGSAIPIGWDIPGISRLQDGGPLPDIKPRSEREEPRDEANTPSVKAEGAASEIRGFESKRWRVKAAALSLSLAVHALAISPAAQTLVPAGVEPLQDAVNAEIVLEAPPLPKPPSSPPAAAVSATGEREEMHPVAKADDAATKSELQQKSSEPRPTPIENAEATQPDHSELAPLTTAPDLSAQADRQSPLERVPHGKDAEIGSDGQPNAAAADAAGAESPKPADPVPPAASADFPAAPDVASAAPLPDVPTDQALVPTLNETNLAILQAPPSFPSAAPSPRSPPSAASPKAAGRDPEVRSAKTAAPDSPSPQQKSARQKPKDAQSTRQPKADRQAAGPKADAGRNPASRAAPKATHKPAASSGNKPPASTSGSASSAAASQGEKAAYFRELLAHVQNYKRYPEAAERAGITGAARLSIAISRSGGLQAARLVSSAGNALLDKEAISVAQRAAPYPPPPRGVGGQTFSFSVTLRFNR